MNNTYSNIIEQLQEGIYYVDTNKKITLWNKAAEKISGFTKEEVMGKSCADNILRHVDKLGNELCISGCPLGQTLIDGVGRESNIYLHHKNGHRVPVSVRVSAVYDDKKNIVGAVELFSDTTNRLDIIKELEKLKKEVFTDALTQIGNRKFAEHTLDQRLTEWEKYSIPFTVYFIDIDYFKNINDTYGHVTGDMVLKMVANSITGAMRPFDTVCRWGGEEFIVIVPNIEEKAIYEIGERIRMLISKSWFFEGKDKISVTASLGCSTVEKGDDIENLISRADKAMYKSKQDGRDKLTIF